MTRLEHLSQFSNAVLSPELNTCAMPLPKHGSAWATVFDHNQGEVKLDDIAFRKAWCEQQIDLIGEFGAVMGGGVVKITSTYIENGIKVKVLKGCEFVPRPPRKQPKSCQKYATLKEVGRIRDWANAGDEKKSRRTELSGVTGIAVSRIYSVLAPSATKSAKMTKSEFAMLMDAIGFIERKESRGKAA